MALNATVTVGRVSDRSSLLIHVYIRARIRDVILGSQLLREHCRPLCKRIAHSRTSLQRLVPPRQVVQKTAAVRRRMQFVSDSPVQVREVLLEIEVVIFVHKDGNGDVVPAEGLVSTGTIRPKNSTDMTKEMSAIVHFPPTSHSCLARTPSRTPNTRRISF